MLVLVRRAAIALALAVVALIAPSAQAFIDPPYLSPEHPIAGETVSVKIRAGVCDAIGELPGAGYPRITQDGNVIRMTLWSSTDTDPILCNVPIGTGTYAFGAFPPGSYTIQVDRDYFGDLGGLLTETLGVLPFTVAGAPAPPVAAPTSNGLGLALLMAGVLGLVAWRLRRHRSFSLLLALTVLSPGLRAQEAPPPNRIVELLLTTAPGAPTAKQVVDYYQQRTGAAPLPALASTGPAAVQYLLPLRAEGDFLARLEANPNGVRAKLERYLLVTYPEGADVAKLLTTLRADPYVAVANEPVPMDFSSVELTDFGIVEEPQGGGQYGRDDLNIGAAWQIAGGYALVADIDSGLYTEHPALKQFSPAGQYLGGNFIPVYALDVGLHGIGPPPYQYDTNVDEREAIAVAGTACSGTDGRPIAAGHGTHTAGLIAANGDAGLGVQGACKNCGIAMWKVAYGFCSAGNVVLRYNPVANAAALTLVADYGVQVANMSFGGNRIPEYCTALAGGTPPVNPEDTAMCLAIDHAWHRDVTMVGASGNNRIRIQFPANDTRVIAAGGFQHDLVLWDESPGGIQCPGNNQTECGTNYTQPAATGARQELMASAKSVLSTTYPGVNWNATVKCGDGYPGSSWGNGIGWCTGTSMSAPQISGSAGLLRSINPLVRTGKPTYNPLLNEKAGVRSVLASTTAEAQDNQPWDAKFGHGHPDVAAAARKMLGKVAGATVRNRVTPLFRLYSAATKDYADPTSPQTALSLTISSAKSWAPPVSLPPVPNYPSWPYDDNDPDDPDDLYDAPPPTPRASVYVLTTEFRPRNEWPALRPLHLMDKSYASGIDFMLATTTAEIEAAHGVGYNLRTIQGYIYQPCTPEPQCIPPAAKKLWRQYKAADNDCAVFLDTEKASFEAAGYTAACPAGGTKMIGYAYPATDTDGDGLPDGFEYVVGTSPTRSNSDGDSSPDAAEFPMVGVPLSDPCGGAGSTGSLYCLADSIFRNGFDGL